MNVRVYELSQAGTVIGGDVKPLEQAMVDIGVGESMFRQVRISLIRAGKASWTHEGRNYRLEYVPPAEAGGA